MEATWKQWQEYLKNVLWCDSEKMQRLIESMIYTAESQTLYILVLVNSDAFELAIEASSAWKLATDNVVMRDVVISLQIEPER